MSICYYHVFGYDLSWIVRRNFNKATTWRKEESLASNYSKPFHAKSKASFTW
jgi:hypothetical protein